MFLSNLLIDCLFYDFIFLKQLFMDPWPTRKKTLNP
jgi:hypothetical protein